MLYTFFSLSDLYTYLSSLDLKTENPEALRVLTPGRCFVKIQSPFRPLADPRIPPSQLKFAESH